MAAGAVVRLSRRPAGPPAFLPACLPTTPPFACHATGVAFADLVSRANNDTTSTTGDSESSVAPNSNALVQSRAVGSANGPEGACMRCTAMRGCAQAGAPAHAARGCLCLPGHRPAPAHPAPRPVVDAPPAGSTSVDARTTAGSLSGSGPTGGAGGHNEAGEGLLQAFEGAKGSAAIEAHCHPPLLAGSARAAGNAVAPSFAEALAQANGTSVASVMVCARGDAGCAMTVGNWTTP